MVLYTMEIHRLLEGKKTLIVRPNCGLIRRQLPYCGDRRLVKEAWTIEDQRMIPDSDVLRWLERYRRMQSDAWYGRLKPLDAPRAMIEVTYAADSTVRQFKRLTGLQYHHRMRSAWHLPLEYAIRTIEAIEHPRPNYLWSLRAEHLEQMGMPVTHYPDATPRQVLRHVWRQFDSWAGDAWWLNPISFAEDPSIWCFEVEMVD